MEIEIIKAHWKNGKLRYKHLYLNNVEHGPQKKYRQNGNLYSEHYSKYGQKYGIRKIYNCGKYFNYIEQYYKNNMHGIKIHFDYDYDL